MKKKIIMSAVASILTIGIISTAAAITAHSPKTGADTSPVTSQLTAQSQELANHDARISNTENDVKDLQNKTNTAPSQNNVVVPPVNTPATQSSGTTSQSDPTPSTTPTSNQVTIITVGQSKGVSKASKCVYSYSDGTIYSWDWKDSMGNIITGVCDDSVIGQPKAN